jgi:hypothetical protein
MAKKVVKKRLNELKKKTKRLQLKHKDLNLSDLFKSDQELYRSDFTLTDNSNVILFYISDEDLEKNNLTKQLKQFNLNEDDLQIQFNKQKPITPKLTNDDSYEFEDIGFADKTLIDWFSQNYPKCTFYRINNWFGKEVNTLLIVLSERNGKPVGVVKTFY